MDGHGHQQLLDVAHQEPVVIWRDAVGQERKKSGCDVEGIQNRTENKTHEPRGVFLVNPPSYSIPVFHAVEGG